MDLRGNISIINYHNREIVRTHYAILKGIIDVTCDCENLELKAVIWSNKGRERRELDVPVNLINYSFTMICELNLGVNIVKISTNLPTCSDEEDLLIFGAKKLDQIELIYEPNQNNIDIQPLLVYCKDDILEVPEEVDIMPPPTLSIFDKKIAQINVGLKIVQSFYSEQLYQNGLGRKSFTVLSEFPLRPMLLEMKTSKEAFTQLTTEEVYKRLAMEVMRNPTVWNPKQKYVAFIATAWKSVTGGESEENVKEFSACDIALGAGGLAVMPLSIVFTWPETVADVFKVMNDKSAFCDTNFKFFGKKSTVSKVYSATMGCLAHEIGHLYDLGHSSPGIMGTDYPNFNLFLCPPASLSNIYNNFRIVLGRSKPRDVFTKCTFGDIVTVSDFPTLDPSSAAILFYHHGFYHEEPLPTPSYDLFLTGNVIHSTVGLASVQLRQVDDGQLVFGSIFENGYKVLKFPITKKEVKNGAKGPELQLLVMDLKGNIMKIFMPLKSLPATSFTSIK